jgi:hypothetical protein
MRHTLVIVLIILITNFCSGGQSLNSINDNYNVFKKQVVEFINLSKTKTIFNGKYNVYCVNLHINNLDTNSYCFTMTYIMNEYDINLINSMYFLYIDSDIVLINERSWFNRIFFNEMASADKHEIIDKLMPNERGFISGIVGGLIFCSYNGHSHKVLYRNSDDMPSKLSPLNFPWERLEVKEIDK